MGWRFRQSFTIIPGLRLNLSSRGLSASIGSAPFTLYVGPHGVMGTASIPGTGLSYRQHLYVPAEETPDLDLNPQNPQRSSPNHKLSHHFVNTAPIEEVHSASTELLTSATLKDLKNLLSTAQQQQEDVNRELDSARTAKVDWEGKYLSWSRVM
jgi:hypothetical protein